MFIPHYGACHKPTYLPTLILHLLQAYIPPNINIVPATSLNTSQP